MTVPQGLPFGRQRHVAQKPVGRPRIERDTHQAANRRFSVVQARYLANVKAHFSRNPQLLYSDASSSSCRRGLGVVRGRRRDERRRRRHHDGLARTNNQLLRRQVLQAACGPAGGAATRV